MGYDVIAWLFTAVAGLLIIALPRKWAVLPLFAVAFLIPLAQRIVIAGLDFSMVRLLIIVGFLRLLTTRSPHPWKMNAIDKAMVLWMLSAVITYSLLWQTSGAFINRLGVALDTLGIYFLIRGFVSDLESFDLVIRAFVYLSLLVAAAMLVEWVTGRNGFFVFGGVPQFTEVREGRMRAQGAFMHPIMAGTFGASLFPLFFSLAWAGGKRKLLALVGMSAAVVITVTSASSTPAMAFLAGVAALCCWPLRRRMRMIRWGMLCGFIALDLVMKAPVYALIGRIDVAGGSTGFHRQYLMEQFFKRFDEWWLVGVKSTEDWGPKFLVMHDVTNQFIRVAVDGGLLTLGMFILVIALCFRDVGRARLAFEKDPATERLCWAFGASLVVHLTAFQGSSYFDQMIVVWYSGLALIASLAAFAQNQGAPVPQKEKVQAVSSKWVQRSKPVAPVASWNRYANR